MSITKLIFSIAILVSDIYYLLLSPRSASVALRQLSPIHKKGP